MLVPKLQLGNPVREALASRDRTGSWSFQDCIPKLKLGNERTLQFFVLFVFFVDRNTS